MTNTTKEYWDVDGVSLNTYAWNIATLSGRLSVPPLRGADIVVPHRAGQVWRPRVADARTVTLGMWVRGSDANGLVPRHWRGRFNDNWEALQRLLFQPSRQVTLTRRRISTSGTVRVDAAKAQVQGGIAPEMQGPGVAAFTVDFLLADPYFYSAAQSVPSRGLGLYPLTVAGDVPSPHHTVRFAPTSGFLSNPVLRIKSGSTVLSTLTYEGALTLTDSIMVSFPDFLVYADGIASARYFKASQRDWLVLDPSANSYEFSADSGDGTVVFTYVPAWL